MWFHFHWELHPHTCSNLKSICTQTCYSYSRFALIQSRKILGLRLICLEKYSTESYFSLCLISLEKRGRRIHLRTDLGSCSQILQVYDLITEHRLDFGSRLILEYLWETTNFFLSHSIKFLLIFVSYYFIHFFYYFSYFDYPHSKLEEDYSNQI